MNGYDEFKSGYPQPAYGGGWLQSDAMKTCPCAIRSGLLERPSGAVVCATCGGIVLDPPPPPKERP